jgi:hypothetical protein
MPGARCARGLVCKDSGRAHTSIQVTPESPGIPRAMVLRLISCSPRSSGSLVSVARGIASADLAPASRRQDHTTSPSASGALVRSTIRVHRIPPRARDDRETPLKWDGTAANIEVIWVFRKTEYFCRRGLTDHLGGSPSGKSPHPPWRRVLVHFARRESPLEELPM